MTADQPDLLDDCVVIHDCKPSDICGECWIEYGQPFPDCIVCNGSRVIPSVGDCPECKHG